MNIFWNYFFQFSFLFYHPSPAKVDKIKNSRNFYPVCHYARLYSRFFFDRIDWLLHKIEQTSGEKYREWADSTINREIFLAFAGISIFTTFLEILNLVYSLRRWMIEKRLFLKKIINYTEFIYERLLVST